MRKPPGAATHEPTSDTDPALLSLLRFNADTAMPLYQQLEDQISALIADGRLGDGAVLPAERRLAEALGVSRATVQRCYTGLRERQLIRGAGRLGSVVVSEGARLLPGMDKLKGFTQEMKELGRRPSTRVLDHAVGVDRPVASIFGLPSTARFLRLKRLRCGDDIPMSIESAWYSLEAAPSLETADVHGSIYDQLSADRLPLAYCDQTVEAVQPSRAETALFGFSGPTPCLLIKRRSYLRRGPMVEYVEGLFRGDLYTYRLRLDA